MLRVISDALSAADARYVTLLGTVDLSAAFDCVDHPLLLERLQRTFGLTDDALRWMTSFVTGRTQQVVYNGGRPAVANRVATLWSSAGVRLRPCTLQPLHCRCQSDRHKSWTVTTSVC